MGGLKPGEIRFSRQRPLQHNDPDMAPTTTSARTSSEEHLTLTHKLRKPQVEKLRRERINSSIEQLKSLLGPEFLKQPSDSKMEKADILEMTVYFLRQKQLYQHVNSCSSSSAVTQGYSRCVQETLHFLCKDEVKTPSQRRLLDHFHNMQPSSDKNTVGKVLPTLACPAKPCFSKEESPVNPSLWRPW